MNRNCPRTSRRALAIFLISVFCFGALLGLADERIRLHSKINGKRANLIFDSGADSLMLFRSAAQRLGLKFSEATTNEALPPGRWCVTRLLIGLGADWRRAERFGIRPGSGRASPRQRRLSPWTSRFFAGCSLWIA